MLKNKIHQFKIKYQSNHKTLTQKCQQSSQRLLVFDKNPSQTLITKKPSMKKIQYNQMVQKCQKILTIKTLETSESEQKIGFNQSLRRWVDRSDQKSEKGVKKSESLKESMLTERNDESFIDNLPCNSLFYCCSCYTYVFEIEKSRHYPFCKDKSQIKKEMTKKERLNYLLKIVELAEYTNTKKSYIEQLYEELKHGSFEKIYRVSYPQSSHFFNLEEIIFAFVYTYEQLLKGTTIEDQEIACF